MEGIKSNTSYNKTCYGIKDLDSEFYIDSKSSRYNYTQSKYYSLRPNFKYKQDPQHFYKKGHQYKTIPPPEKIRSVSEVKKPPVPTVADKPIMGLKSDKNYITSNAIDNILMPTRKKAKEEMDYLHKKYYGEVPPYLTKLKKKVQDEYVSIREMQRRNEEEDAKRKKVLSEEEIKTLREGLLKKLEQLKYSYGQITHKKKYDTLVLLKKKEGLEKEMEIIEKDLQSLNNKNVIVDLTK